MTNDTICVEPTFDMFQEFIVEPITLGSIISPTVKHKTSEIVRMAGDEPSDDYLLARVTLRNELTTDWWFYPISVSGTVYRLCSPFVPYKIFDSNANSEIVVPVTVGTGGFHDERHPGYARINVQPVH